VVTENGGSAENASDDGTDKKTEADSGIPSQTNVDTDQKKDINGSDATQATSVANTSAFTKNVTDTSEKSDSESRVDSEDLSSEALPEAIVADRREEVPALLGGEPSLENEKTASDVMPPRNQQTLDKTVESEKFDADKFLQHFATIQETLKDAVSKTEYISTKIETVSSDTECLIKQVNNLSTKNELLFAEVESITSGSNTKGTFSNTYLTFSSVVLVLLVISQLYIAVSLYNAQPAKHGTSAHAMGNMSSSAKQTAGSGKNESKPVEHSPQQEHSQQQHPTTTVKTGHDLPVNDEMKSANATPVLEKINKLRNGLLEKKLIRKETGDWFVYNKKAEECLIDTDIIETLNQAYKKAGRALTTTIPLPAHNVLCILKPDGKGGTEIVITQNFVP
jgi:hypothetical protein